MTRESDRSRFLQYLPAIFQQGPEKPGEIDLGQFLLPFEEVLSGFEDLLAVIDRHISPALTPDEYMPWLASWVALNLDENWAEGKQRRLIREAVELYRCRGMVAGLKRYLEIYDVRVTPDIWEGHWPGGMQIGVASQIGGLSPEAVALTRIEHAERRHPPITHDYYVVHTVAPGGHPNVPQGQPLKLYYRADRVKGVEVGGEGGRRWVRLRLVDGPIRHHEPATVIRRDQLVNDYYTLSLEREAEVETFRFKGDTLLVDRVDLPYRFTVDLQVPCEDWGFLFRFQIESEDSTRPEALRRTFEAWGITLAEDMIVTEEEKGKRWWTIDDGGRRYLLVRKGVELSAYQWLGCRDWEEARQPGNVGRIRGIVDEVKPAHTIYYLKITPVASEDTVQPMQIGVHSRIDVDTAIG